MLILGHRGTPDRSCAENSLPAFQKAIELGADGIELDLRCSRDGEIVVVHDANLHRIAGDAHKAAELTAQELADIPLRHTGCILTLNDVTAAVHEPAIFDFEIKHHSVVIPLAAKLRTSASLRERSIVSSFHPRSIKQFRKECPDVKVMALFLRWPLPFRSKSLWQNIKSLDVWGVGFPLRMLTPRRVALLRTMGYAIAGWDRGGSRKEAIRAVSLNIDVVIVKDVGSAVAKRK